MGKFVDFRHLSCQISETMQQGQSCYWRLIGICTHAFNLYQNLWPWMTLRTIIHYVTLCTCLSEPIIKIWMKIDPYYWRQECSADFCLYEFCMKWTANCKPFSSSVQSSPAVMLISRSFDACSSPVSDRSVDKHELSVASELLFQRSVEQLTFSHSPSTCSGCLFTTWAMHIIKQEGQKPTLDVTLSPLLLPKSGTIYLPPSVLPSLHSFKHHLKTHYFTST